ncbi:fatty acid synthase beta subunit [Dactylonectria estremocensis]|uniref:Fatty acid synthase beta subunit n=1 Tax=Dactylonectria estremocensis TaxID=1079267 RepID=A0A9P9DZU6_9HYPO|nr:fatty acid synthase beta subunit [Dactylonectria estremocensis]
MACNDNLKQARTSIPTTKLDATQLLALTTLATSRQEASFSLPSQRHDLKGSTAYVEPTPPDSATSKDESEDKNAQSSLELVLAYADQISEKILRGGLQDIHASREALRVLIDYMDQTVLASRNIHTVVASSPVSDSQKSKLLRSYYEALHAADVNTRPQESGLFGTACSTTKVAPTIYTVFGGQGLRSDCVQELGDIITTYPSLTKDLIHDAATMVANLSSTDTTVSQLFPKGLDILAWLHDPAQVPDSTYLASAPVSAPLIGLVQLAHYEVTCKTLGLTPGQFRSRIAGTTGHSQGIITAAATAVADDWPSWREVTRAAITTLFWIGVRTQQAWNALQCNTAVSEAMVQDSIDHGERAPSPMLSVRGLTREDLQTCIDATNRYLKHGGRYLAITMTNGPRHFVVSGPPKYLYGLNLQIRKAKQLLVQQKKADDHGKADVVGSRFLDVSVPFHTNWLDEAIPSIQDDVKDIRLPSSAMAIPVFSTEDGRDTGSEAGEANVLHRLVELVVRRSVDWDKATDALATHTVLDFGPGGVHGIGSLSSSARVILAGTLSGRKAGVGYKGDLFL